MTILDELKEETGRLEWVHDPHDTHFQPEWIGWLGAWARLIGADWVIPSDADEFWYATSGLTLADELAQPQPSGVLGAPTYFHLDWDTRYVEPVPAAPKVAFGPGAPVIVHAGNHDAGSGSTRAGLEIRSISFRGADHFADKWHARCAKLDPKQRAIGAGSHLTMMESWTDAERLAGGRTWHDAPTVFDPIPSRTDARPRPYVTGSIHQ